MGDAGFRGVSADQDGRFGNKEKKLLKHLESKHAFPKSFERKVDLRKVSLQVMQPWIEKRVAELLGFDDDVVTEYVTGILESDEMNPYPDPRKLQISLTGFLESSTPEFMRELWDHLLSAQESIGGIPKEFVEKKKEEMRIARERDQQAIATSGVRLGSRWDANDRRTQDHTARRSGSEASGANTTALPARTWPRTQMKDAPTLSTDANGTADARARAEAAEPARDRYAERALDSRKSNADDRYRTQGGHRRDDRISRPHDHARASHEDRIDLDRRARREGSSRHHQYPLMERSHGRRRSREESSSSCDDDGFEHTSRRPRSTSFSRQRGPRRSESASRSPSPDGRGYSQRAQVATDEEHKYRDRVSRRDHEPRRRLHEDSYAGPSRPSHRIERSSRMERKRHESHGSEKPRDRFTDRNRYASSPDSTDSFSRSPPRRVRRRSRSRSNSVQERHERKRHTKYDDQVRNSQLQ